MKIIAAIFFFLLWGTAIAQAQSTLPAGLAASSGISSYHGPLDVFPSAAAYYGLRAASASAASAGLSVANVCTALDVVCADFTTTAAGGISTSNLTLQTSCAVSGACTIKEFYDQSGNANHATDATIANRAKLSLACTPQGKPCPILQNGSTNGYTSANAVTLNQPFTFIAFAEAPPLNANIISLSAASRPILAYSSSTAVHVNAGTNLSATVSAATWHSLIGVANGATNSNMVVDGANNIGNGGTTSYAAADLCMFNLGPSCNSGTQLTDQIYASEVIVYLSAPSSLQIQMLAANQLAYW